MSPLAREILALLTACIAAGTAMAATARIMATVIKSSTSVKARSDGLPPTIPASTALADVPFMLPIPSP